MSRITRYLVRTILGFTAISAFALVAIYTFISFVSEIDETGQGGFGMLQLVWYTLMMVPAGLYTLMPIIALLGTLMGLGALAAQNEITAMRASGVTVLRLGGSTLAAGVVLGALALVLGDWLAPAGTTAARAFKTEARYEVSGALTDKPVWLRDGRNIVHIRVLQAEDAMANVDIYTLGPELAVERVMNVESARFERGRWQLSGIRATRFGDSVQVEQIPRMVWDGTLSPEVLRLFVLEANSLSTPGLLRLIAYMQDNGLDASEYRLSLWRKLVAPMTVVAMMLFAVPFCLGSQRGGGAGQRLLVGILVGLVFYVVNEVTASFGQLYAWPAALAAGLPTVLLTAVGISRLQRAR